MGVCIAASVSVLIVIRRLLEPDVERRDEIEIVLNLLVEIRGATEALETLLQDARAAPGET